MDLLEKETLDKEEVEAIFTALSLRDPRPAWTGSARRRPDTNGPVLAAHEALKRQAASRQLSNGSVDVVASVADETPEYEI